MMREDTNPEAKNNLQDNKAKIESEIAGLRAQLNDQIRDLEQWNNDQLYILRIDAARDVAEANNLEEKENMEREHEYQQFKQNSEFKKQKTALISHFESMINAKLDIDARANLYTDEAVNEELFGKH